MCWLVVGFAPLPRMSFGLLGSYLLGEALMVLAGLSVIAGVATLAAASTGTDAAVRVVSVLFMVAAIWWCAHWSAWFGPRLVPASLRACLRHPFVAVMVLASLGCAAALVAVGVVPDGWRWICFGIALGLLGFGVLLRLARARLF